MPAPHNEGQALERERKELPDQVATYQRESRPHLPRTRHDASGSCGRSGGTRNGWVRLTVGWPEASRGDRGGDQKPARGAPRKAAPPPAAKSAGPALHPHAPVPTL